MQGLENLTELKRESNKQLTKFDRIFNNIQNFILEYCTVITNH